MDIIAIQEAKKVKKMVGKIEELETKSKDTTVSAINELAYALSMLLPEAPDLLSTKTLSLGIQAILSYNVPDNTGGNIPAPGSSINATRALRNSSNKITSFGPGKEGTLSVQLNGVNTGERDLSLGDNVGVYGDLHITREGDYPQETPGFYKDLDAMYTPSSDYLVGYNEIQMLHSESGNTNKTGFVLDDGIGDVVSSGLSVQESSLVPEYSSGIPHYGNGSKLRLTTLIQNAITKVHAYIVARISGNGISTYNYSHELVGLIEPVQGQDINLDKIVTLNSNFVGKASYSVRGFHPLASGNTITTSSNILVKIGSGGIDEGKRVNTADMLYPNEDPVSPLFDSSINLASHEAKIVGGVLKFDKTDYSINYMPVGPNYSSHNDTQYVSFVLPLVARTNATININGSYDGCWIKLPTITGWLDTGLNYPGAGNPNADGDACKVSGDDNSFSVTFGTQSTSNCSNVIVLRLRLVAGNSITAITVS